MSVFVCFNRCLICGRRTSHEVCHLHSTAMGGKWPDISVERYRAAAWRRGFDKPEEVCTSQTCPQSKRDWQ